MRTKYQYLFLLTSFLAINHGHSLLAQTATIPVSNPYPEDFIANYMTDCQQMSQAGGIPPEDSQIFCRCTINQFQDQYTLEQFEQLTKESENNNQEASDNLSEVGYACLEEILYED